MIPKHSDDLENQSAAFLAKEADPDGMRTIGEKQLLSK